MNRLYVPLCLLTLFFSCRRTVSSPESLSISERADVYASLNNDLRIAVKTKETQGRSAAIPLFEHLLSGATERLGSADSAVAQLQGELANQYFYLFRYREAADLYRKAIGVWTVADRFRYAPSIATFQTYLGSTFEEMGRFNEAIAVYDHLISYYISKKDTPQIVELNNLWGLASFKSRDFKASVSHFETALRYKPNQADRAMLLHNLGRSYRESGDSALAESLTSFQKVLQYPLDSSARSSAFVELALTELGLHNFPAARAAGERSLAWRRPNEPLKMAESYRVVGEIEATAGNSAAALAMYQNALQSLVPGFQGNDFLKNPDVDAENFDRKIELVEILNRKVEVLNRLHQTTGKLEFLEAALAACLAADVLIQKIRREAVDEESKFFWNHTAIPLYESGVADAYRLYEIMQKDTFRMAAFRFCRRTKAPVLTDALRENRIKDFVGVPATVRRRELDLKMNIASAQKQALDSPSDSASQHDLFEARRRLNDLQDTLRRQYARYFRIAYETPPVGVKELRDNLADSTLALEYFLSKNEIYTFAWTKKDGFQSFKSPRPPDFDARFDQFMRSLRDQDLIQDKTDSSQYANRWFCENAFGFYQLLLQSPLDYFNKNHNVNRLRIVPDGKLAYLPFDVLTDRLLENWHARSDIWKDYLVSRFAVSYVYNDEEILPPSSKRFSEVFGGFSVSYQNKGGALKPDFSAVEGLRDFIDSKKKLYPLPYAKKEVAGVSILFGGSRVWNEAQKSDFLQNAATCGVIHLSLHGYMDENDPTRSALIFARRDSADKDFFLSTSEIYGMQFSQTGLAILSACNTGNGKLQRGEGVMSMARAFEIAGCPAAIVSLWSIPDSSTANIMQRFHIYQASGVPKDLALQHAKIDYLQHNQSGQFNLPNYWAATALIGETSPVICARPGLRVYFYIFTVLALLALLFFIVKKQFPNFIRTID